MAHDANCIFCKIVEGSIPASKVYEDDDILAFLDLSQVTKGHTLVIPKDHVENIFEMSEETASTYFRKVPQIANAMKETFNVQGVNILNNSGEVSGQTVFHYHMHILPRYGNNDGFDVKWHSNQNQYTNETLQEIAKSIENNIIKK
ncbi:HIT family protein [Gottfriedia acidiceleris]|uniref:HIT family protein n=1 Tax=Gottfriedia acidiceleris TaxID=371036 RepID=A0ABY4JKW4_9BACI|nr:HIT family protein [Gottfriedia acidiceleris]UPM53498.1 HIT family protein [Gottfriedia acidiceleris]